MKKVGIVLLIITLLAPTLLYAGGLHFGVIEAIKHARQEQREEETVIWSSGTYTLTADTHYQYLIIKPGVVVDMGYYDLTVSKLEAEGTQEDPIHFIGIPGGSLGKSGSHVEEWLLKWCIFDMVSVKPHDAEGVKISYCAFYGPTEDHVIHGGAYLKITQCKFYDLEQPINTSDPTVTFCTFKKGSCITPEGLGGEYLYNVIDGACEGYGTGFYGTSGKIQYNTIINCKSYALVNCLNSENKGNYIANNNGQTGVDLSEGFPVNSAQIKNSNILEAASEPVEDAGASW